MKRFIVALIVLLCGCSPFYKIKDLPEPVRDEITTHINAYLIRPTNLSSELFKEKYEIDMDADINIEDFRVLIVDWDTYAHQNKDFTRGMIYVIDHFKHPYKQENQIYPENPWEKELKQYTDLFIRGLDYLVTMENGVEYNMFEGYDYEKLDTGQRTGQTFYFKGANEEEIINYIQQIPLSIQMDGDNSKHYIFGYCSLTYLINDVNLFVEGEDGEMIKISK